MFLSARRLLALIDLIHKIKKRRFKEIAEEEALVLKISYNEKWEIRNRTQKIYVKLSFI